MNVNIERQLKVYKEGTQKREILDYLKTGKSLNRGIAQYELLICEAPARISEMRKDGYDIVTKRVEYVKKNKKKKQVAIWSLKK
ncbi:MAG: hypothetical protein CMC82_05005 [Flavobacteriaceae bacterium]|nr:hypothetical protein [Flavobacteriaceae bacterium]